MYLDVRVNSGLAVVFLRIEGSIVLDDVSIDCLDDIR